MTKEVTQTNANDGKLKEKLAAIEHERWAHWQKRMHDQCKSLNDGSLVIPGTLVGRWRKQIETPYAELTEKEKDSDREQIDRYWPLIQSLLERRELIAKANGRIAAIDEYMRLCSAPWEEPSYFSLQAFQDGQKQALAELSRRGGGKE